MNCLILFIGNSLYFEFDKDKIMFLFVYLEVVIGKLEVYKFL